MTEPTKDDLTIADQVIASHLPPGHRREVLRIRVARAIAAERDRIIRRSFDLKEVVRDDDQAGS